MPAYAISLTTLRQRIRELRQARGYTQEQLAHRAGLGEKYLQNLEAGRRANPSMDVLNKVAEALEVHMLELLYEPQEVRALLKQITDR
jgi:transcriptional regulator with XRE-family HTH domain